MAYTGIISIYQEQVDKWTRENPKYPISGSYASSNDRVNIRMEYNKDHTLGRIWSFATFTDLGGSGFYEQLIDMKMRIDRNRGLSESEADPYDDDYDYGKISKKELWAD